MSTAKRNEFKQILGQNDILSPHSIKEFGVGIKDDYKNLFVEFPITDTHEKFYGGVDIDIAATFCQKHYYDCINIIFSCQVDVLSIEKRIGNYFKGSVPRSNNYVYLFKCSKSNWKFDLVSVDDIEGIDLDVCNVVNSQTNEKVDMNCSFFYTSPLYVRNFMCLLSSANFETYQQTRFEHVESLQNLLISCGYNVVRSPWETSFCKEFNFILTIEDKLHVIVDAPEFHNYPKGEIVNLAKANTMFVRIFPTLKQLGFDYQQIKEKKREREKHFFAGLDFAKILEERDSLRPRKLTSLPKFEECFPLDNESVLDKDNYDQHLKTLSICIPYETLADFENVTEQILRSLSKFD
jgi:hypothetical protein